MNSLTFGRPVVRLFSPLQDLYIFEFLKFINIEVVQVVSQPRLGSEPQIQMENYSLIDFSFFVRDSAPTVTVVMRSDFCTMLLSLTHVV